MFSPICDPIQHLDESILVTNNPCSLPDVESPKWGGPPSAEMSRLQQVVAVTRAENMKLREVWGAAKKDFEAVKVQNRELQNQIKRIEDKWSNRQQPQSENRDLAEFLGMSLGSDLSDMISEIREREEERQELLLVKKELTNRIIHLST